VKRSSLLQHLRRNGCFLKREGSSHSLWINAANGAVEAIPRHTEIPNNLARTAGIFAMPKNRIL
jgi:mRNA interferase HicA